MGASPSLDMCYGPARLTEAIGPPTAAVCPPGECVFTEWQWAPAKLRDRQKVTHDTVLLTFALPDEDKPVGLTTCACLLAGFLGKDDDPVVRPYTPVSTNALLGSFQLLMKVYDTGKMGQFMNSLPLGSSVDFRHVAKNVKIQYPFEKRHVTMLAGGSGITPFIQALHAILGTARDTTEVTLLFGNKSEDDIICKDMLESWSRGSKGRLKVVHTLSKHGREWKGLKGRIGPELIKQHTAPPSEDVLVMICGPPAMYDTLCGPRDKKELSGVLKVMGYRDEQVFKF
uniref:NADH-cytochrome b5 reductase n=1 Tax=Alexandrium monilatum TaxID=311494 RepID=A0A7S4T701_9DINO|mmetsp:Transcript_61436/g.183097  ORF Transcript_61436/g.183097 Transcript_61436/m.183097 type:complete len:285 (-) Transcript_61436:33-887(-)